MTKLNLMIYGDSGIGKTYLASQIANAKGCDRTLLLDFDKNSISAIDSPNLTIEKPASPEDLMKAVRRITKGVDRDKYNCVILDTISAYSEAVLNDLSMEKNGTLNFGQRAVNTNYVVQVVRLLKDSPMNVVILCHAKEINKKISEDELQLTGIKPRLPGQMADIVCSMVNAYWLYHRAPDGRRVLTTKDFISKDGVTYKAKTAGKRFPQTLDQFIFEPNMTELFDNYLTAEYTNITKEK